MQLSKKNNEQKIRQNLAWRFADTESYEKIQVSVEQSIAGVKLTIRKQNDTEYEFNNFFIAHVKQYSDCKGKNKRDVAITRDEFTKVEGMAKNVAKMYKLDLILIFISQGW